MKKTVFLAVIFLATVSFARAQAAEVTIQLDEQFFDALLDALFKNANPPEFPLAQNRSPQSATSAENAFTNAENTFTNVKFEPTIEDRRPKTENRAAAPRCTETIKLLREIDGTRTSVRFRDGQIYVPIAFSGNYNPPLIGCVGFSGVAETNILLEYDRERQSLVGRAKVSNVNLSGTGGIGGSVIARLVQNSIDKKINPIQILQMDKVSFNVPIQNSGNIRMQATGVRHEIANGVLNVHIGYDFSK